MSVNENFTGATEPLHGRGKSGAALSKRAAEFLGKVTPAADFTPHLDHSYVVKHWLNSTAMSVVYGDSNVGKTFFALNLAQHVAAGIEWNGCRVRGGPVLYIAAEGGHGFGNRVAAIKGREGLPLWCLPTAVDLCKSDTDTRALIDLVKHLASLHGGYALIVIDTLARSMGSGDENASPDMGAFVRNLDRLRAETEAHLMAIHHSGKDTSKGARGHSSLRAATDTEIELTKEGDVILAEARKQRDMAGGRVFAYQLREVELGHDQDGDAVTTCVVEPCEPVKKKPTLGPVQRSVLDALREYVADYGQPNPGGTGWPATGAVSVVDAERFLAFVSDQMTNDNPKDRRKTAKRALDGLVEKSLAAINGGKIWLV